MSATKEEIAEAVIAAMLLLKHRQAEPSTEDIPCSCPLLESHNDHHAFVDILMKKEERINGRNEKIRVMVAGSVIISFTFLVIGWIGSGALSWAREHIR